MQDGILIQPKHSIFPETISLAFKTLFNIVACTRKWFCIQLRDHLSLFQYCFRPKRCRSPWGTATYHFTQESTAPLPCLLSNCSELCLHRQRGQSCRKAAAAPSAEVTTTSTMPSVLPAPPKAWECASSCCSACGCCLSRQAPLAASHFTDLSWAQGCAFQHKSAPAGGAATSTHVSTTFTPPEV